MIKYINREIRNIIVPKAYILKVKPNVSAEIPTTAGPNIAPKKAILDTWEMVIGIGLFEYRTACLNTIGITFEIKNPNIVIDKNIIVIFWVIILKNNIIDPTIAKQGPTINSLNFLINLEAKILPMISPALKKITIDPTRYIGADKSVTSQRGDHWTIIPINAIINILIDANKMILKFGTVNLGLSLTTSYFFSKPKKYIDTDEINTNKPMKKVV